MSSENKRELAGFGQSDPTDNRRSLDWQSKYSDPEAQKQIHREAIYLGTLLACCPLGMFLLWLGLPVRWDWVPAQDYASIMKFGLAWLAGTLGGTLFDIKWLYHSVARQRWHLDRRLWRIFTPHISGALAFAAVAIITSDIVRIFDRTATSRSVTVVGIAFLVGYFSDSSIAKLSEIAETLFGTSRSKERHASVPDSESHLRTPSDR